ncbi:L-rhamnose isomerase, partial [Vibrio parahaemolyticus]
MSDFQHIHDAYQLAKTQFAHQGIDTEAVLAQLNDIAISVHCWQG